LQQTQADRVIPFLEKILHTYPDIHTLAAATYDEFFPYYQGLGYYSRARNILKTAHIVSTVYGGIFPTDTSTLRSLPGVGPYTASAIQVFGYGIPTLAWDTNLEKIFSRYIHGSRHIPLSKSEKENIHTDFRRYVHTFPPALYAQIARDTNNALMDYASIVDTKNPTHIDWSIYPVCSGVFYTARGTTEVYTQAVSTTFPIPDATVHVYLHQGHRIYYTDISASTYSPFVLPPALHRDIRTYVQSFFRSTYGLEVSVRPVHSKWLSTDGKPYIAVNAQIQTGEYIGRMKEWTKGDMQKYVL
jgi:A/G-specific adenine glycosylase